MPNMLSFVKLQSLSTREGSMDCCLIYNSYQRKHNDIIEVARAAKCRPAIANKSLIKLHSDCYKAQS